MDNARDRIKQLNNRLNQNQVALKTEEANLEVLNNEQAKERKESAAITEKIKKMQDAYNEIKQLKQQVLERREKGTSLRDDMKQVADDDENKFSLENYNQELLFKTRTEENRLLSEYNAAERAYSEKVKKLDEDIANQINVLNLKVKQLQNAESDKKGAFNQLNASIQS